MKQGRSFIAAYYNRGASASKCAKRRGQSFSVFRCESPIRFIRPQALRPPNEGSGELGAPFFAARQLSGPLIEVLRNIHFTRRHVRITTGKLAANHCELLSDGECRREKVAIGKVKESSGGQGAQTHNQI
jgi:hypothetical protein